MIRLILILSFSLATLMSQSTLARADEPLRYAIVVGANHGDAGDEVLRYAARDADEVAKTLQKWGKVTPKRMRLLHSPSADQVVEAIRSVNALIAKQAASSETSLLVYYSGHADATELHLAGSRLSFKRVRDAIEASPAQVKVLIVDSCRSGELTRVKGASQAPPFQITANDRLDTEGMAIITSSAASEDAQESERLRGGVFTHHLVTGLLGAADTSRDRRVTLTEAYNYAYEQTLRSTSRARFVQHPTFAFQMRGKRDLVVTQLMETDRVGHIRFEESGNFIVQNAASKRIVAELRVSGITELVVDPGTYTVVLRRPSEIRETELVIKSGRMATVVVESMRVVDTARTADKGTRPGAEREARKSPFAFGVAIGSTFGIVKGNAETYGDPVRTGLAYEAYHLRADLGYWVNEQWQLSLGARIGVPAGANTPGHASYAPALYSRVTHALSEAGRGWSVHGDLGLGYLRHTVSLSDALAGEDRDTIRSGPILLGAGARWTRPLGPVSLLVDLNALAAPKIGRSGTSVSLDFAVGLGHAF